MQKHIQNSFGIKLNCIHDEYSKPIKIFNSSKPDEVNREFVETLESYAIECYKLTQQNKDIKNIKFIGHEKLNHYKCKSCFECKKTFDLLDNKRVAHHDHITGRFISSICSGCNLQLVYKRYLPVYLHNLKGYDAHLFIKCLNKYGQKGEEIKCILNNEEKYISFNKKIKVDEYFNKKTKQMEAILL